MQLFLTSFPPKTQFTKFPLSSVVWPQVTQCIFPPKKKAMFPKTKCLSKFVHFWVVVLLNNSPKTMFAQVLRMISTVTHPSQDGVGIAGPQVGLSRRIVAVQRFDKVGEPFEVYANVKIVWMSDSLAYGPEGCLSVPDRRGNVLRSQEIVIEYADIAALQHGLADIPMVRDTVTGFTAVIFQHEIDHLEGVLYIDRL